jgi:DNA repair protein RAD50
MEKALRTHESDLHVMQLRESDLNSKLRDRAGLEKRIEEMRNEIVELSKRLKVKTLLSLH